MLMVLDHEQNALLSLQKLYSMYNRCLDDKCLHLWPNYFTDDCTYRITTKQNYVNGWPLSLAWCDGKDMAIDRAIAISESTFFRDRTQRRYVSGITLVNSTLEPEGITMLETTTVFSINETVCDMESRLLVSGTTQDIIQIADKTLLFKERVCIIDSEVITDSIVYPI